MTIKKKTAVGITKRAYHDPIVEAVLLLESFPEQPFYFNKNSLRGHPEKALILECCYGVCRFYNVLVYLRTQLIKRPVSQKKPALGNLILVGLYQLHFLNIPKHHVVYATVKAVDALKISWAKSFVNAILRSYLRQEEKWGTSIHQDPILSSAHPEWLYHALKERWSAFYEQIILANNTKAPFCLRVNEKVMTREEAIERLRQQGVMTAPHAWVPTALVIQDSNIEIETLDLFQSGIVSVQDPAAQLAVSILAPKKNETILDACAAPGGKTLHLIQATEGQAKVVAVDLDSARLEKIQENLTRANVEATLIQANLEESALFAAKGSFDRILLDPPCSATGVIRHHPDIKNVRTQQDIQEVVKRQKNILSKIWPLLREGGILLYATCSIFPEENDEVMQSFLEKTKEASVMPISLPCGIALSCGVQLLPGVHDTDGFYFSLIKKRKSYE